MLRANLVSWWMKSVCRRGTMKCVCGGIVMQLLHLKQLEQSKTMFFYKRTRYR